MNRTVSLSRFMPYGAPDLLAAAPAHLSRAVIAGSALAVAAFLLAGAVLPRLPREIVRKVEPPSREIAPPLSFRLPKPPVQDLARLRGGRGGEPVIPVPDRFLPPDFPEAGRSVDQGEPDSPVIPGIPPEPPLPGDETTPRDVVLADELPVPTRVVTPEYPALARDAGVDGLVIVHVLVGRDGKVLKVEIDDRKAVPMLDESALAAAWRWEFTPAFTAGRPVPVWVALPFRFTLR